MKGVYLTKGSGNTLSTCTHISGHSLRCSGASLSSVAGERMSLLAVVRVIYSARNLIDLLDGKHVFSPLLSPLAWNTDLSLEGPQAANYSHKFRAEGQKTYKAGQQLTLDRVGVRILQVKLELKKETMLNRAKTSSGVGSTSRTCEHLTH